MKSFEKNIISIFGQSGKQWLLDLPHMVNEIAETWNLSELTPVKNLSYNYVLFGTRDNQPIILKIGCDPNELQREANALRAFAGYSAIGVLEQKEGALLLECAIPGNSLKDTFPNKDDEGIEIACGVMKRLHQAPITKASVFPHIRDWLTVIEKDWDIPPLYLNAARLFKEQLLATSPKSVLLHGDLHHDNILKNRNNWVVIDPKGVIGDPVFEVAAFIRNPSPELLTYTIIEKRIGTFSECLNVDEMRVAEWCFVGSVLSWIWGIEDGIDLTNFIHLPELFFQFVANE